MTRPLIIPLELIEKMRAHVQECLPEEACGILGGSGDLVKCVIPVTNQLHSPVKFFMAPEEQFKAFMWLEENTLDMLGYYHSHPTGPDHLSETDLKQSFYPGAVLVLLFKSESSPQGFTRNQELKWQVKGFIIEENTIKEISIAHYEKK